MTGPAGRPAILLVLHGSRSAAANAAMTSLVDAVRARAPAGTVVEHCFMPFAQPTVADGVAACARRGAARVLVHPLMLSPGVHADDNVPRLAREAAATHRGVRVEVTAPLGPDPRLAALVLERCGLE